MFVFEVIEGNNVSKVIAQIDSPDFWSSTILCYFTGIKKQKRT